jgi:3-phenylpropionate/trans-cinnamate dioxygenase ferredoxin reductase subunit
MTQQPTTPETFDVVIVGAGQAGAQTALSLRKNGFTGTIALIGSEKTAPYERPPLSKAYLKGQLSATDLLFRDDAHWAGNGVELLLGSPVTAVEPQNRTVTTAAGKAIGYGSLVWAAGGHARTLPLPGADLDGVHTLRTLADADALREKLTTARSAVIIGGGYIGLEAASVFSSLGLAVTVLEAQDRLLARVTGSAISGYFARLHASHGVDIRTGAAVAGIVPGVGGSVGGVELDGGEVLPADIVIIGVGLVPNIEPLRTAGLACSNGVDTTAAGATSSAGIFAAGDCANAENSYAETGRIRLESVQNAVEMGKRIAAALTRTPQPAEAAPWFWSNQYATKLQTVGLLGGHDETVIRGDQGSESFTVAYLRQGRLVALDCVNTPRDFAQGRALVERQVLVNASDVADTAKALKDLPALTAAP